MRAWQVHEFGDPDDVLSLNEIAEPAPAAGEVVVEVEAAALNYPDVLLCRGEYQERPQRPFVPGFEVAGRVVDTGADTSIAVGQRVAGMCVLPHGGLAERTVLPETAALSIPDELPAVDATAMLITYTTGYAALHRRAAVCPGEFLLVHAGAGGVGSAAIQLGLSAGARVLATAGGPEKVATCLRLGAELALDYRDEDFVAAVKEHTAGHGADVIVDPVGGDVFDRSTKVVAFEGRIVLVGFAGGRIATLSTNHALVKNYSVLGLHWGLYRSRAPEFWPRYHEEVLKLYASGAVRPLLSAQLTLDEVPEGMRRLSNRDTIGKLVVRP